MPDWLSIPLGLITLVVAGDILVRGAAWIAIAAGIRPMVVGVTVVAFGTSAPELAASIVAALHGQSGLATGTVFGSNIANIGLIVGLSAAVAPVGHVPGSARFEVRCLLAVTALLLLPMLLTDGLDRLLGVMLLIYLAWFTVSLVQRERRARRNNRGDDSAERGPGHERGGAPLHLVMLVTGLVGLPFGAGWLVEGASGVAEALGLSEQVIAVAIVAVGTSLPELAASVAAAKKGHPEIALGNVLGSNLFNCTMVLGGTAVVAPLPMTWQGEGPHALVGLIATLILAYLLAYRRGVGRRAGIALVAGYVAYIATCLLVLRTPPG